MLESRGPVADRFADSVRERERESLSALAVQSYETRGRELTEDECRLRTPFQRDRDRITHSKSFRRLKGKTQVFIDPAGDHFRTRMTHTLETTAISRVVARALRLNEDLVEAIGVGHDVGHPPFGHAGESALDKILPTATAGGSATTSSRAAPSTCSSVTGRAEPDLGSARRHPQAHPPDQPETLEGKIVRLVDRVAYINHDIDDAVSCRGPHDPTSFPREEIAAARRHGSRRVDRLVHDLVETSEQAPATSRRARRSARRCCRSALVHVRARLPRAACASTSAYGPAVVGRSSTTSCSEPELAPGRPTTRSSA